MLDNTKKELIAIQIIELLNSRNIKFDSEEHYKNYPFHKYLITPFISKIEIEIISPSSEEQNISLNSDKFIQISRWSHGLSTAIGQKLFENTAYILSGGTKRTFPKGILKISSAQNQKITDIISELKSGTRSPNLSQENQEIYQNYRNQNMDCPGFTVDNYIENTDEIVAIEIKSPRPNSGEMKGEKQKILYAKAGLKNKYPNKTIHYLIGFPFDPFSDPSEETESDKDNFISSNVEFSKFFSVDEILLGEEYWNKLFPNSNTMEEILVIIRNIATEDFLDKFRFINSPLNYVSDPNNYTEILERYSLNKEIEILEIYNQVSNSDIVTNQEKKRLKTKIKRKFSGKVFRISNDACKYNNERYESIKTLYEQYQSLV